MFFISRIVIFVVNIGSILYLLKIGNAIIIKITCITIIINIITHFFRWMRRIAGDYFPLYEEAQRLDTMLAIHGGTQGIHTMGADQFQKFIEVHTYCFPAGLMLQMTSMMFSGIPELFPDLRLGWMEAGCGWVPYWMQRMDEEYEMRGEVEAPVLKRPPSEYLRDGRWYFHTESDERMLPQAISEVGEGQITYASDFPHWDSSYPDNIDAILTRDDLSTEVKRKVLGENARALYGLR